MRTTLCIVAALAGCAPPEDGSVETSVRPIVDGMLDSGDPAMVEVFAIQGNMLSKCTATLVSPRVLLTAAHCIAETQGARYGVFLGNNDARVTSRDLLPVKTAAFDPTYSDNPGEGHDIGVVVLSSPLAIPVVRMNRDPLSAAAVGALARYVGYGLTDGVAQTGDGIKRQGSAPIAQVGRDLIRIAANPHGTCNGDSGGPLLLDSGGGESIIGVVSFGTDATCRKDSYFQRLDTQVAWVDAQIRLNDPGAVIAAPDGGVQGKDGGAPVAGPDASARDVAPPADTAVVVAPPPPADAAPVVADAAPTPAAPAPAPAPAPAEPDAATAPLATAVPSTPVTGGCSCEVGAGAGRRGAPPFGASWLVVAGYLLARRRRR